MTTLTASKASFNALNLFFHKVYTDLSNKITVFKIKHSPKNQSDSDFTYDLDAMKKALSQTKIAVPKSALESDESFDKWLNE